MYSTPQAGLFDNVGFLDAEAKLRVIPDWPEAEKFPLNRPGETAGRLIHGDLSASKSPLVVTGYASLDRIISFVAEFGEGAAGPVRLVFGNEPFEARTSNFTLKGKPFPEEVRDYWLERGVSLFFSAKIIAVISLIESGRVKCRFVDCESRKLHAKIYVGDEAVTVGSSNFTANGMGHQLECNVRFQRESDKRRYRDAVLIAENLWGIGSDYNEALLALLRQLLRVVTWQEALARACAELLEGEWADRYLEHQLELGDTKLWPSQRVGIAQALWVLENIGSVLVADPTGSGKTRMGAHLIRALVDRLWSKGRARRQARRDISVLVCPPSVELTWQRESTSCGLPLQIRSHGVLSRRDSEGNGETVSAVRRAQILSIDEAHNFLKLASNRTQEILANMADSVVLFTATPINRNASDLLALVDMLGADNMEEETLKVLEGLARRRSGGDQALAPHEVSALRREIQRFTLRRTKAMLNAMVDKNPEQYVDAQGKTCRYPRHNTHSYQTDDTVQCRELARKIRETAKRLKGIALIEPVIEMPESFRSEGWTDESYLLGRLSAAKHLSLYNVMSRLRSSRAALFEHLLGTQQAIEHFKLPNLIKGGDTGDIIGKLRSRALGDPIACNLKCAVPQWLVEREAFQLACNEEILLYDEILVCLKAMSAEREKTKVQQLLLLVEQHRQVIAFDSHLITLAVIEKEIKGAGSPVSVLLATGADHAGKKKVMRAFGRDSQTRGIALCSDSMSEGVNLQGASAVMHLDMPSVVRIAEQRVGRVDRMDSPHAEIDAYWPDDPEEFALRSDEKFVMRYQTVETLLGSNMPLPASFGLREQENDANEMFREAEDLGAQSWDGIQDAFSPVRDLIEGQCALVSPEIYENYIGVSIRVLSRVGVVRSKKPWAFFAVSGVKHGAPKWVFFEGEKALPITRLDEICEHLRERLNGKVENLPLDQEASIYLQCFLEQLNYSESALLPRKKQRALEQMFDVTSQYVAKAKKAGNFEMAARWQALTSATQVGEGRRPDLESVAENWLDLIRPLWFEKLRERRKRRRPLLLKDLRQDLVKKPFTIDEVERRFQEVPVVDSLDQRIAACIVGVPSLSGAD